MRDFILMLIFGVVAAGVTYKFTKQSLGRENFRLELEVKSLKEDIQYAEGQAYSDCQRMLQANAIINKVDGCMMVIERLCNEKAKDVMFCIKSLMPECNRLGE